mmetsp:Transcript_2517/g.5104  ORF Transcript_2517/g.5104 Transcript_2517/m.5104 type:complete len:238 (+) Transcript_2517:68-781(+)
MLFSKNLSTLSTTGIHHFQSHQRIQKSQIVNIAGVRGERAKRFIVMAANGSKGDTATSVLFLCLGNICRSPTAEAVFRNTVEKNGASYRYVIDSCGTGGGASGWYKPGGFAYHEGDAADSRMRQAASARGIRLTSRSRPLKPDDLEEFDMIVCMDEENVRSVSTAVSYWKEKGMVGAEYRASVTKMTQFLRDPAWKQYDHVPDPYYGGSKGFELVLDLLDDACEGLFEHTESSMNNK